MSYLGQREENCFPGRAAICAGAGEAVSIGGGQSQRGAEVQLGTKLGTPLRAAAQAAAINHTPFP